MQENLTFLLVMRTTILPFKPQTRAVVGFYITNNKILLGKRLKSGTNLGIGLYAGIGGKLEQGETSRQALKREFQEEIKATPTEATKIGQVSFVFLHKEKESKWNMIVDVFRVTQLSGKPQSTTDITPVFFSINNIPYNNMWQDNFYWLPLVIKNLRFQGEFIYKNEYALDEIYLKLLN